jgi:hypothetical protein
MNSITYITTAQPSNLGRPFPIDPLFYTNILV